MQRIPLPLVKLRGEPVEVIFGRLAVHIITFGVAEQVFQREMAIGEDLVGADQGMADAGPGIVLQDGVGHCRVSVNIFIFVPVAGIGVSIAGIQTRQGFEIEAKKISSELSRSQCPML